jgi:hypothetical protein
MLLTPNLAQSVRRVGRRSAATASKSKRCVLDRPLALR